MTQEELKKANDLDKQIRRIKRSGITDKVKPTKIQNLRFYSDGVGEYLVRELVSPASLEVINGLIAIEVERHEKALQAEFDAIGNGGQS